MTKELPIFVMKENWWDKDGVEWTEFCHMHRHFITVKRDAGGFEPRKRPFEVVVYTKSIDKTIQRVEAVWYATMIAAMAGAKTKSSFWGASYDKRKAKKEKERTGSSEG